MNVARYYDLFFSLNILNNCMEQSPSSEADTSSSTQDIPLNSSLSQKPTNGLSTEPDEPSLHIYNFTSLFESSLIFPPIYTYALKVENSLKF
jgi:hypothetical protein